MGKSRFYRVETWSYQKNRTIAGALSVVQGLIFMAAGVPKEAIRDNDLEKISEIVNLKDNKCLRKYIVNLSEISGMSVPDVYEKDRDGCRCLFTSSTFNSDKPVWVRLNHLVQVVSDYKLELQWKSLYVEKSSLLYKDPWQAVISADEYTRHKAVLHRFENIENPEKKKSPQL